MEDLMNVTTIFRRKTRRYKLNLYLRKNPACMEQFQDYFLKI
jgi:hypothetical protein